MRKVAALTQELRIIFQCFLSHRGEKRVDHGSKRKKSTCIVPSHMSFRKVSKIQGKMRRDLRGSVVTAFTKGSSTGTEPKSSTIKGGKEGGRLGDRDIPGKKVSGEPHHLQEREGGQKSWVTDTPGGHYRTDK